MQELRFQSLGQEDPLQKEMATHFQYSCLGDPMDRGAGRATVHGVTESQTQLSDETTFSLLAALGLCCCVRALPSRGEQGAPLPCGARASHCRGFSRCRAQALGLSGFSSCDSRAVEHRLNSHGTWTSLLCGMWDLPRARI